MSKNSRIKHLNKNIVDEWSFNEILGDEGKDGIVLLVKNKINEKIGAIKLFKPRKSINKIKKELNFHQLCSENNISPPILSNWDIDNSHLCFIMKKMNRRLLDVVKDQNLTLTEKQINRIIFLYSKLDELNIMHNDPNIFRNILEDENGELFLIDFGMSKKIDNKIKKKYGPKPNLSLLRHIDYSLKTDYFSKLISDYEEKYSLIIDHRKHMQQKIKERTKKLKFSK